jgi:hypothetical protein
LAAADKAWSRYAELRAAGKSAIAHPEGQFDPGQLNRGSAAADKSIAKGMTSEGRTAYGEFARAGLGVGIENTPKPSTMAQLEALGMTGIVGAYHPAIPAVAYPSMWIYSSPWGQALARGYLQHGAPMARTTISQGLPRAAMMAMPPSEQESANHLPNVTTIPAKSQNAAINMANTNIKGECRSNAPTSKTKIAGIISALLSVSSFIPRFA